MVRRTGGFSSLAERWLQHLRTQGSQVTVLPEAHRHGIDVWVAKLPTSAVLRTQTIDETEAS
jgi:hypothetical protein